MLHFWHKSTRLCATAVVVSSLTLSCGDDNSQLSPIPDLQLTSREIVLLPGCEHISHELCDVMQDSCQRQIFSLMACLRGDSAMENELPPIARLNVSQAIARMSDSDGTESTMPAEELLHRVRGLELLGLAPPGEINANTNLQEARLQGVLAYYSPVDREVVLIDRGDSVDSIESNTVLGHELVHALQDKEHDLYEFGLDNFGSSDQEVAAVSLVEGEASWYEIMMLAAYNSVAPDEINLERLFSSMSESADRTTYNSGSAFLSSRSIFPYTHGARYAAELWLEGGTAGIDARYETPPQTTLEVLYGSDVSEAVVSEVNTMPAPLEEYAFLVDDVAGAWVIHSLLKTLAGPEADATETESADDVSLPLSASWRGDRFWVYHRDNDDAIASLWAITWQEEASASRFEEQLPDLVEQGVSFSVWTEGTSTRLVVLNEAAAGDEEQWVEQLIAIDLSLELEPTQGD